LSETRRDPPMVGWVAGSAGSLKDADNRRRPVSILKDGVQVGDALTLVEARRFRRYLDLSIRRVERLRGKA
jgi:hypothetical protein